MRPNDPDIFPKEVRLEMIPPFVKGFIKVYGYPPAFADIARMCKSSKSTAFCDVHTLIDEGTLELSEGQHRTVRVAPGVKVRAMALGQT